MYKRDIWNDKFLVLNLFPVSGIPCFLHTDLVRENYLKATPLFPHNVATIALKIVLELHFWMPMSFNMLTLWIWEVYNRLANMGASGSQFSYSLGIGGIWNDKFLV